MWVSDISVYASDMLVGVSDINIYVTDIMGYLTDIRKSNMKKGRLTIGVDPFSIQNACICLFFTSAE